MSEATADQLARLSSHLDQCLDQDGHDPQAITWGRVARATEEVGKMTATVIGATGQNPRRGVTHTKDDVIAAALNVAIAGLGIVEHLTGNLGMSLDLLDEHVASVVVATAGRPDAA